MPTYEDIAFKVIVKNDGISDVIFKTLMLKGEAGGTISNIEKTSSVGVVDTYTITLNDGTTTTFEVTNGSNIASIEKTATAGLIDTYTVTLTNGDTSTFEVKNGEDAQLYELPKDCVVGYDHEPTQTTVTSYERYIQIDDVNGISSVKYNGNTLQETNDGRNLLNPDPSDPNVTATPEGIEVSSTSYEYYSVTLFNSTLPVGSYVLKDFKGGSSTTHQLVLYKNGSTLAYVTTGQRAFTVDNTSDVWSVRLYVYRNNTDPIVQPQLEAGSQPTSYQPYCGGIPSPNPSYPQKIVGVGDKQQDNTYSVDLVAEDADGNAYTVTASGLTHPVYAGDWIDLVAGVLHRANGYKVFDGSENDWYAYTSENGYAIAVDDMKSGTRQDGRCNSFLVKTAVSSDNNIINFGLNTNNRIYIINANISGVTDLATWKTWLSNNNTIIVYPLATPTEESITLTGDLEQVKRIRGEYAYIDAPLYASTEITFGQETDFPDGYEEIDFPLDDMFYYQDQEYIEFPTSWGFVMGYVFDASEIRFTMNVTKDLKEGFNVVANKSINLALNLYTGAGGSNLTGFNFVEASFIREYGQIQIRLKTENPHGLTVGSLLGARVSQGRLRITFEEVSS